MRMISYDILKTVKTGCSFFAQEMADIPTSSFLMSKSFMTDQSSQGDVSKVCGLVTVVCHGMPRYANTILKVPAVCFYCHVKWRSLKIEGKMYQMSRAFTMHYNPRQLWHWVWYVRAISNGGTVCSPWGSVTSSTFWLNPQAKYVINVMNPPSLDKTTWHGLPDTTSTRATWPLLGAYAPTCFICDWAAWPLKQSGVHKS